jgi:hypothetical protein
MEPPVNLKFCRDCNHYFALGAGSCTRRSTTKWDLVTGEAYTVGHRPASEERRTDYPAGCSEEARYFVLKLKATQPKGGYRFDQGGHI